MLQKVVKALLVIRKVRLYKHVVHNQCKARLRKLEQQENDQLDFEIERDTVMEGKRKWEMMWWKWNKKNLKSVHAVKRYKLSKNEVTDSMIEKKPNVTQNVSHWVSSSLSSDSTARNEAKMG